MAAEVVLVRGRAEAVLEVQLQVAGTEAVEPLCQLALLNAPQLGAQEHQQQEQMVDGHQLGKVQATPPGVEPRDGQMARELSIHTMAVAHPTAVATELLLGHREPRLQRTVARMDLQQVRRHQDTAEAIHGAPKRQPTNNHRLPAIIGGRTTMLLIAGVQMHTTHPLLELTSRLQLLRLSMLLLQAHIPLLRHQRRIMPRRLRPLQRQLRDGVVDGEHRRHKQWMHLLREHSKDITPHRRPERMACRRHQQPIGRMMVRGTWIDGVPEGISCVRAVIATIEQGKGLHLNLAVPNGGDRLVNEGDH